MIHEDLQTVYSVGEITQYIKDIIDGNDALQNIYIKGEISNLTKASSGHVYFTLKDKSSQLPCVMFRNFGFSSTNFNFKQGDQVMIRGSFSIYVPHGRYQFYVREIQQAGLGMLYQQFLLLKSKLEEEGLFDEKHKKTLIEVPEKIGVLTSPDGAVIHDIIKTLKRKYPLTELLLYPVMVQGEQAAAQIIQGLYYFNTNPDIDVIIIARGGGSFEDLWCFNDEKLARAIFNSIKPVISAVGHETDFTIADFVADYRAPTPTAAAELAVPDILDITNEINESKLFWLKQIQDKVSDQKIYLDDTFRNIHQQIKRNIKSAKKELYYYARISGSSSLREKLKVFQLQLIERINKKHKNSFFQLKMNEYRSLESLHKTLKKTKLNFQNNIMERIFINKRFLESEQQKINMLDISSTLKRGFSISMKGDKLISSVNDIEIDDQLTTIFKDGRLISKVKNINK